MKTLTYHTRGSSLATAALAAIACAGCVNNPVRVDNALEIASSIGTAVQAANMSETDEISIGKDIAANTLGSYPVVRKEKLQRYVNQVGTWVAQQSGRPTLPWRFAVVQSDQVNAFAVPGGAILVTTGMMGQLANEAELACVLGHEVGHVVRKHHLDLLQKGAMLQAGASLAANSVKSGSETAMIKQYAIKQGAELFNRSLDRGAERDADLDGVLLAARAGYDPGACISFMQRLAARKVQDNSLASLYKTHPQASDRVSDVRSATENLDGAAVGKGRMPSLSQRN